MNLFILISFLAFTGVLAAVLLLVAIWKDLAAHFRTIRIRFARKMKPLADAARLNRDALRLNRATLRFDGGDWTLTGGRI